MRAHDLFDIQSPLTKYALCCAPSPPPAPDLIGSAREQGVANVEAARTQARLNNPNVVNPYGTQSVTWGKGSVPDQATVTQKFSPAQQAIFDASNEAKLSLSQLAARGSRTAGDVIGKNLTFSGLPGMPGSATGTRDKVIAAMMGRVDEDTGRRREELNSNLIAAGIRPGSKAYNDQMHLLDRSYNDARNQAFLSSGQEASRDFALDTERRRTALSELLAQRQTPLNEITALMSGAQVQNPFAISGYAQNSQVQAPPLFAAQNALSDYNADLYNAQAAQAGNLQSGLIGLGTTGAMAAALM